MLNVAFTIEDLEYFLLILTRVSTFIYVAPIFGTNAVPSRVKIVLSFFISFLLYYAVDPVYPVYSTILGYAVIVLKEAVTGILIGWGCQMCTNIASLAGRLIDMESGLSMVSEFDPATSQQVTITGLFYNYMFLLMLIVSGMYEYIIRALADTFVLIPINGMVFNSDKLLNAILIFIKDFFVIGFRISLPVFAVIMLMNTIFGILAKIAPQLNMFAVGIQMKILTALSIMFLTVGLMPSAASFIFEEIKKVTTLFVEAML
jgi:flagellar biosynthetic protein FliR